MAHGGLPRRHRGRHALQAEEASIASYFTGHMGGAVASYAFLIVGLVGVYGHIHAVPFFVATFWQVFLVLFGLFAALQHFMPKTQLLFKTHGVKAVVIAAVIGVLLLVPMFLAVGIYGFNSVPLWA